MDTVIRWFMAFVVGYFIFRTIKARRDAERNRIIMGPGSPFKFNFFWIRYGGGQSKKAHITYLSPDGEPYEPLCGYYADIYNSSWKRIDSPEEGEKCKNCIKKARGVREGADFVGDRAAAGD